MWTKAINGTENQKKVIVYIIKGRKKNGTKMGSYEKRKIKEQFFTLEIKNMMNTERFAPASAEELLGEQSLQEELLPEGGWAWAVAPSSTVRLRQGHRGGGEWVLAGGLLPWRVADPGKGPYAPRCPPLSRPQAPSPT